MIRREYDDYDRSAARKAALKAAAPTCKVVTVKHSGPYDAIDRPLKETLLEVPANASFADAVLSFRRAFKGRYLNHNIHTIAVPRKPRRRVGT